MLVAAIDFDGVLHDHKHPIEGMKMGAPIEGSEEAMRKLKRKGYELVILSTRGGSPQHISDWMQYYHIPFDEITDKKINASFYLDDKGIRFTNWNQALEDIWQTR